MDYIEIQGYKSIKAQRIDLKNINILIGANGSGKSNFLLFFEFLKNLYQQNLQEYVALRGGLNKFLHHGQKVTDKIYFKVEFENGLNGYAATLKAGDDGFVVTGEKLFYQRDTGKDISNSCKEASLKTVDNYRAIYIIKYLEGFRKYHFHDTGAQSPFSKMSNCKNDIYYLYEKGENLAAFLYNIRQQNPVIYHRIVKTVQSVAPYFSDFFLEPNANDYISLQWKDKYNDIVYGINDLSDGTIRFIALTTLFMQPNLPQTIIIDEPELGLHPAAIIKLAGMIQSSAAKNSQVILATQSTDLISHFQPEDIITADREKGETVLKRLNSEELSIWLEDYAIDDLWKKGIIATGQPNYK
ncbi:MAG: AAA family ATPase [Prevotellaceae bacterium]|nr:AAA family ATPase [Prevotellaceae bacterium]